MSFIIGVDVGGTNTDVAILQGHNVIGWSKSLTTNDIITGVKNSICLALSNAEKNGHQNIIMNTLRVNIGTTQFINAVVNCTGLEKVACIRLCGITSHSLPPFCEFPIGLKTQVAGGYYLINGGLEYDEKVITEINRLEISNTLQKIVDDGIEHVAVAGIFSPINSCQEKAVENIIKENFPLLSYTLSSTLGGIGLLERENAAILNESLKSLSKKVVSSFQTALFSMGLGVTIYFTQNDGTLLSYNETLFFPVHTFSSGATNSMRGAAFLSSVKNAIIVDIGGTTSDVGVLKNGFPRQSSVRAMVGGVNINFRMPETVSIGVGGGSLVKQTIDGKIIVGPESVGFKIAEESLVFGGKTLVASDIAVAKGLTQFGDRTKVSHISSQVINASLESVREQIRDAVDSVRISGQSCTVIIVGGGSILLDPDDELFGKSDVKRPKFYQVANAVGAAISQVCGLFDQMCIYNELNRDESIENAKEIAIEQAVESGAARSTCRIVEVSELKMQYMALPHVRLTIKAVGDIEDLGSIAENELSKKIQDFDIKDYQLNSSNEANNLIKGDSNATEDVDRPFNCPPNSSNESTPEINDQGEWILNEWDVECLAIGAGILGSGGGGSTYLGRLKLKQCLKNGKYPKIIHPNQLAENCSVFSVAYIGAPGIAAERITDIDCLKGAMQVSKMMSLNGFHGNMTVDDVLHQAKVANITCDTYQETVVTSLSIKDKSNTLDLESSYVMPFEIGGSNALEPLIVAAELGIPVIDCDGAGRAFPELQQFCQFIYDVPPCPAVITDIHGNSTCCITCSSPADLEIVLRTECVKMGCMAGFCPKPLTKSEVLSTTCLFTLSHAWYIGNAVMIARRNCTCPTSAIIATAKGKIICQGRISDVKREVIGGFTRGSISVEGQALHAGNDVVIEFQNEFIIARSSSENVLATVPDLITVVDTDTGEPIATSDVKFGLNISVLVLPAMPMLTTPRALEFCGPKGFHINNVQYERICDFEKIKSIPRIM